MKEEFSFHVNFPDIHKFTGTVENTENVNYLYNLLPFPKHHGVRVSTSTVLGGSLRFSSKLLAGILFYKFAPPQAPLGVGGWGISALSDFFAAVNSTAINTFGQAAFF